MKIHQEKRSGQWENRTQILLPGYIFLYTSRDILPPDIRTQVRHLYKALEYEKGMRILTGSDEEYAMWIYRHNGIIGTSRITVEEGQAIQVIDGPLLDCQGTIIKLDKHKRRAMVAFTFDGQKRMVSISAECVHPIESKPAGKAGALMASTTFTALNTLLIGIFLTTGEVAEWSLCLQMVSAVMSLYTPVTDGIYPYMLNASYNLALRNIKAYIPEYPVGTAEECADMIHVRIPSEIRC